MRVTAVCQAYVPDTTGIYLAELAAHWEERGHEVTVVTAQRPVQGHAAPGRVLRTPALPYERSTLVGRLASQSAFFVGSLAALAREPRPDVLLMVGAPSSMGWMTLWLPSAKRRTIEWVMDLYPEAIAALWPGTLRSRLAGLALRPALDRAFCQADAVVALSTRMCERIARRVPCANVRGIPLWAPPTVYPRGDRGALARDRLGIRRDAFVVLHQGNFGLAYDFRSILDAALRLRSDPDVTFVLAGGGAQRQSVQAEVRARALTNVRMADSVPVEALGDSLAMGDLHVVSVRPGWDGVAFPAKFVSALASGRPVAFIGPADTEIGAMIREDLAGAVLGDGNALAAYAKRLRNDEPERVRCGAAARAAYERRFDRGRAFQAWDEIIESS